MHLPPDSLGRQPIENTTPEKTTATPESKESEIPKTFQQALNELSDNFTKVGLDQKFPPGTEAEQISREEIDELAAQMLKSAEGKSTADPYGVEELVKQLTPFAEETDTTMDQYAEELAKELESATEELLKEPESKHLPTPTHLPPPPEPPETDNKQTPDELDMHSETESPKVASKKTPPPVPPQSSKPKLISRESQVDVEKPVEEEPPSTTPKPLEASRITPMKTETTKPQKEKKSWWSNIPNIRNLFGGYQWKKPKKKAPAQVTIPHNVSVGAPQGFAKKGVSLQELLKQAGQAELLSEIPNETKEIPPKQKAFVNHLIEALRKNHLGEEGLTRVPGNKDQVDELRSNLEQYADDPEKLADKEPHALASALSEEIRQRSYLFGQQEMENLLILGEGELYSDAEGNVQLSNEDIHALNDMNILDDHPNADVIRELLDLCIDIVNNQETTKMGLSNIVMTLSPVFIDQDLVMGGEDPGTRMKNRDKVIMKLLAYRCMDSEHKLQLPKAETAPKAESQEIPTSKITSEGFRQLKVLANEVAHTQIEPRNWKSGTVKADIVARDHIQIGGEREMTSITPGATQVLDIDRKERIENLIVQIKSGQSVKEINSKLSSLLEELSNGPSIIGEKEFADFHEFTEMVILTRDDSEKFNKMINKLPPNNRVVLKQLLDLRSELMNNEEIDFNQIDLGNSIGRALFPGDFFAAEKFEQIVMCREIAQGLRTPAEQLFNMINIEDVVHDDTKFFEKLVDIHFLGSFFDTINNVSELMIGGDEETQQIDRQTSEVAIADTLARAYERLENPAKEEMRSNLQQLVHAGRVSETVFELFYGQIGEWNVPDIPSRTSPTVTAATSLEGCIKDLRSTPHKDREKLANKIAGDLRKLQMMKYQKLDLGKLNARTFDDRNKNPPEINQFCNEIQKFTQMAIATGGITGETPDPKEVSRVVKTLILVAEKALESGDYNTAINIAFGISSTPVERIINQAIDRGGTTDLRRQKLLAFLSNPNPNSINKKIADHIQEHKPKTVIPYYQGLGASFVNLGEVGILKTDREGNVTIDPKIIGNRGNVMAWIDDLNTDEKMETDIALNYDLTSLPANIGDDDLYILSQIQTGTGRVSIDVEATGDFLVDLKSQVLSREGLVTPQEIKASAARIFDEKVVENILSDANDDVTTKGKKLGEYYIEVGSHMKLEDKEQFLKLLSGAKEKQANLAKGFVEALLRDDRQHFPLLKSLLQLSFRQDIRSTTDPTTLLRGENIGTRMASQAYQILGTKFSEIITSKLVEVLPEESLEIQPAKLTDEEKAKGEELLQSRQTQLLGLTGVVYATLTENIDQMPEEMKELFQMVHDEVEAAGFGKDAARKAFNSQMYLRFVSRNIPIDTARKFTEATDANRNKKRTCTLLSKMVTNHANELKTSIKEPHMEFMFSKSGENLRDKMMNLTDTMSKPKAKTQLGGFIKTAIPKHRWGRKKRMAGTHRPRSMSAGTLGSHRSRAKGATEPAKKEAESPLAKKKSVGWKTGITKSKKPESAPSTNIVEDVKNLAESYAEGKHLDVLNQLTLLLENIGESDALLMVFSEELGDKLTEFLNQQITFEFQEMNTEGVDLRYDAFRIINQDGLSYKMMNLIFNQNVKTELKEKLLSLNPSELNNLTFESFQNDLPQPLIEAFHTQYKLATASIRHAFGRIPNDEATEESAQKMLKSLLFSFMVDSSWTKSENDQEKQIAEWYQKEFPGVVDFETVIERPTTHKPFKPLPPLKMPKKEQ